jgi:NADH dehydrogenase
MKVLLTGASGFLGNYVLPLIAEKYEVRVFVRKATRFDYSVEFFRGNLLSREDVRKATKDVDVVINLAGIVHQREQKFWDVHVRAVENILRYSNRIVHVSALWASPDGNEYQKSKWWGEQVVRKAESYVIIRPSVMFGLNDTFVNRILRVMRRYPFIPAIKGKVSPVFAGDVAEVIAESVEDVLKGSKRIESLCGPRSLAIEELFRLVAKIFDIKKPFIRIPIQLLSLYAHFNELLPNPVLPKAFLSMLKSELECERMQTDIEEFLKKNREFFD